MTMNKLNYKATIKTPRSVILLHKIKKKRKANVSEHRKKVGKEKQKIVFLRYLMCQFFSFNKFLLLCFALLSDVFLFAFVSSCHALFSFFFAALMYGFCHTVV